jgi:phytanoyl-CoA hydroxylase
MYLTEEQKQFFHDNGYLVIKGFWNETTVNKLRNKMISLVRNADLSQVKTIFNTSTSETGYRKQDNDEYFLNSGGKICYFWEEKAWKVSNNHQNEGEEPELTLSMEPELAINKVGHAIHDLDPDFQEVSYEGRIGSICEDLGMEKPLITQSMYIFKQPRIGGEVVPHQDGTFLYTEPQSCIGFWWPLNDCSQENGCLWIVPGSQNLGILQRYRRKDPPAIGTEIIPSQKIQWDLNGAIPLETKKGDLVVLHTALVHYSQENTSPFPRHAYSIHIVEGKEGVIYPKDNWLQRPEDFPFREVSNRYQES